MLMKPESSEYANPFKQYIDFVPDGSLIDLLKLHQQTTNEFLKSVPSADWHKRYAKGKWNAKEVLGHMIDNEMNMLYRIFRITRGFEDSLPFFEREKSVQQIDYDSIPVERLFNYFWDTRQLMITTCENVKDENWLHQGKLGEYVFSARALAYISAGHELHHLHELKTKYFTN
ncbi:DinB family protein [Jeotgalibacillus haloalkalitolerans]|uniref:DinB family protein n=1 Tax=Jeotgalibacillus haloalkalitolerans TaxID=3104292 RepID=A0ABU5KN59_9BACL|nr:DinB family protein [Jeotgalibacillus sp. HH7-29]MDZ5712700.1 DinB family protein [Jeotgalibacillus sp. HH7-29]